MQFAAGSRLGAYEVTGSLGAGGMGEVFRARDTKLNRDVAIKVLPPHLAADEHARARFEREAKAVAALSHPNILAIYDFAVHGSTAYVVTELLVGETLRERLNGGRLPLRKVVQIGADIARGLAAAHEKGIVHRDVKPENVFVTTDGAIKILDFGLARQIEVAAAGETMPGATAAARTEAGTVMGTVGYMSPEQVQGREADHRSDIFSFGCVLYEAATGRRAFHRATAAETMTAILREDPPERTSDTGAMPGGLEQVVRHCLEKRPEERFQSARDLAFALQALSGPGLSGVEGSAVSSGRSSPARPFLSFRGRFAAVCALALGVVALVAYLARVTGRPDPVVGPRVLSFAQLTDQPGLETNPSLAPDGRSVVYTRTVGGESALWLQRVGARTATRLSGPAPAADTQPAFSPDGERIAFRSERDGGGIFVMSASGESVTRLTDFGFFPNWSPDGRQIVVATSRFYAPSDLQNTTTSFTVVTIATGERREFPATTGQQPVWSPHGTRIAYWGVHKGGQRDLWTVAATTAGSTPVSEPVTDDAAVDWSPMWSSDGRWLYFSSTRGGTMNLWRVPIDESSGRVLGTPEPVTTPSGWTGGISLSRDGTRLAFATLDFRSTLFRVPFDAGRGLTAGPPVPILKGTRAIRDHHLSPDGQWVAFTEAGVQEDLFVARVDGTEYRRLTDDGFRDRGATWSPDGSRIAFYSDRGGVYDLWTIRPDGSGLMALTAGFNSGGFPVWSPDGSRLAYGFVQAYLVDARASTPTHISTAGPGFAQQFIPTDWSLTGDRLAGVVLSAAGGELRAYSVAEKQFIAIPGQRTEAGWSWLQWLSDGRRLVLRRPNGISLLDVASGKSHVILPIGGYMIGRSVGISRDDRWLTYTETATEGDVWIATLQPSARPER